MKHLFANFLFLRAYLGIVLGIVLVALLLDGFVVSHFSSNNDAEISRPYYPLLSLLSVQLLALPPESRESALARISETWVIKAELIPLSAFAGPGLPSDPDIQVYYDNEDRALLYQPLADTGLVLALGPLPAPDSGAHDTWIISAYYLMIALILLLWIRPFSRDLSLLREAAANFGKADFSTRLQLRENSSIHPVAQSFNAMAQRIEYLVSAHRELTNAVSHELRTPLARFKFTLEILARNGNPEKTRYYLDQMKVDVQELEGLIDELLTYARLSEHNLQLRQERLNLRVWLERELRDYRDAEVKIISSYSGQSVQASYEACANPDLMARALHNVIRNGLRYANERINVHLHCNGNVELRICDDGPGIDPARQDSIFEPFSRLETSRDRQSGGYGLGLAIAARIMERHQGSITVHNCEPGGACFILQWPGNPEAETAERV